MGVACLSLDAWTCTSFFCGYIYSAKSGRADRARPGVVFSEARLPVYFFLDLKALDTRGVFRDRKYFKPAYPFWLVHPTSKSSQNSASREKITKIFHVVPFRFHIWRYSCYVLFPIAHPFEPTSSQPLYMQSDLPRQFSFIPPSKSLSIFSLRHKASGLPVIPVINIIVLEHKIKFAPPLFTMVILPVMLAQYRTIPAPSSPPPHHCEHNNPCHDCGKNLDQDLYCTYY